MFVDSQFVHVPSKLTRTPCFIDIRILAFIVASGRTLDCKVVLPFLQYSPETTTISFDVEVNSDDGKLLVLPSDAYNDIMF